MLNLMVRKETAGLLKVKDTVIPYLPLWAIMEYSWTTFTLTAAAGRLQCTVCPYVSERQ
jgi:long-subunit acyl-CoA synthetase (AMP-forming)